MRILHVIGQIDFADGGPPVIATRLAAAQVRLGHEVAMIAYSCAADEQARKQLSGLPGWEKVTLKLLARPDKVERVRGKQAMGLLGPAIAGADVVHLHNVWEVILLQAAAIARAAGKPYWVLVNGMLDPWSLAQKRWKKRLALFLGYRKMLNGAAALHLGNVTEQELIRPLGLRTGAVIIPNGVTLEEIDPLPVRGEFAATRPGLAGRRYLLFLSRLHYKKGLDFLADSFAGIAARHPEVDLVVAGPDGGAKAGFEAQIAAAGLERRVYLVGPLYGREKIAALTGCECFVLPSRQEGFSNAILEAMACSAPVVISDACHFPEVAEAGAGEVVPLSADRLAAALDRVLANPDRGAMGRAGRALVEARYTWGRVAEATIAAYRATLGARGK